MQGSPQTCLAAVWPQEWGSIKLMCHLWSRPAISSARKINLTHTVVTAPGDTEVRVQCKDSPKMVKNTRGQWWLAMGAGCRASTSSWEIVAKDKEAVEDETVMDSVHTVIGCVTAMKMRLCTLLRSRAAQADAVASYANGMKGVTCDTSAS
jgi:hypothetical protein